jgi:hypothetical protein
MLDHGIYLASRGYTPLNLEITDGNVDKFVGVLKEVLALHISDLTIEQ